MTRLFPETVDELCALAVPAMHTTNKNPSTHFIVSLLCQRGQHHDYIIVITANPVKKRQFGLPFRLLKREVVRPRSRRQIGRHGSFQGLDDWRCVERLSDNCRGRLRGDNWFRLNRLDTRRLRLLDDAKFAPKSIQPSSAAFFRSCRVQEFQIRSVLLSIFTATA